MMIFGRNLATSLLIIGLLSCERSTQPQFAEAIHTDHDAVFNNGDFESSANLTGPFPWTNITPTPNFGPGYPPTGSWTVSTFLNATGLLQVPPQSVSDLRLTAGGWPATLDVNTSQCATSGTVARISTTTATESTIVGLSGMTRGRIGKFITLSNAATAGNNGQFEVSAFVSATSVRIFSTVNTADNGVGGSAGSPTINWSVQGCPDRDVALIYPSFGSRATVLNAGNGPGPSDGNRQVSSATCTVSTCSFSKAGNIVTLTRTDGTTFSNNLAPGTEQKPILIRGATSAANNGYFFITAAPGNGTISFYNPAGVVETFAGNYSAWLSGMNRNVNVLTQTMTLAEGDRDPLDNQLHIRWTLAPVLQNPAHTATQQPYFFYVVTNKGPTGTGNTVLATDFNFANQTGVPWQTTSSTMADGSNVAVTFTDWQLIDVAPGAAAAVGDQIQVDIYVAGCQPSGHWARVYVDSFGATIPGFLVSASAPAYYWLNLSSSTNEMTYTLQYRNNSGVGIVNPEVNFSVPAGSTFVSATDSNSANSCTNYSGSGSGVAVSAVSNGVATLTGLTGMTANHVGAYLTVTGATNAGNNGFFKINSRISATSVTVINGSAVTEGANMSYSYSHVRCANPNPSTLNNGSGGSISVVVNIANTYFGTLTAGTYWGQGRGVSPLLGGPVKTVVSGPPASIVLRAGGSQSTTVNTAFGADVRVEVQDANGRPVLGAPLTYTPPSSGASATLGTVSGTTNSLGQLSTTATANTIAGAYNLVAAVTGYPSATLNIPETNTAGAAANVTVTSGGGQSGIVSTAFPNPVVVTVTDSFGNPVSGQAVTFTPPGAGARATFTNGNTNASGQYSTTPTANGTAGGPYTVNVAAGAATTSLQLTNLTTPPAPTLVFPADNEYVSTNSPTLTGTNLSGATVQVTRDGNASAGTVTGTSFSLATSNLSEGAHTWTARQTLSSVQGANATTRTFIVDTIDPAVSVTGPAAFVATATPAITGTATDTNLNSVRIDIRSGSDCTGTIVNTQTTSGLSSPHAFNYTGSTALTPDGTYTACVTATDYALRQTTQSRTFVVDTAAPTATVSVPSPTSNTRPTVSGIATDNNLVSVAIAIYAGTSCSGVAVNSTTLAAGPSPYSYSYSGYPNALVPDGTYVACVSATDSSGSSSAVQSQTFVVDTAAPSITVVAPSVTANSSPAITGQAIDPNLASVTVNIYAGTVCAGTVLRTTTVAATGSPFDFSFSGYAALSPDGPYIVCATAIDTAGNTSALASQVMQVDTTAPTLSVSAPSPTSSRTPVITGQASDPGLVSVQVAIYTGSACSGTPINSITLPAPGTPYDYSYANYANELTPDGTYIACAVATDGAGNTTSASQLIVVDTAVPTVTVNVADPTNDPTPTITGTATDPNLASVDVTVYTGTSCSGSIAQTTTITATGSPFDYSYTVNTSLADGTYTVCVVARDGAGNASSTVSRQFTIDTTPPTSAFTTTSGAFNTATVALAGTANDGAGSGIQSVEVRINGGAWVSTTLTDPTHFAYLLTPTTEGAYVVDVRATDLAGNVQASPYAQVTMLYDVTPPTTTVTTPDTSFTSAPLLVSGTTTDGAGSGVSAVEYSIDGGQTWQTATLVGSDWSFNYTPAGDGPVTVQIRSRDVAGNNETPPRSVVLTFNAACTNNSSCDGTRICLNSGFCGPCGSNADCSNGDVCVAGACGPCTQNSQCDMGLACNPAGDCAPTCTTSADCSGGLVCLASVCSPCTGNDQCQSGQACVAGQCGACTLNSDCAPTEDCMAGACEPRCGNSNECSNGLGCVSGHCSTCGADSDCVQACRTDQTCGACRHNDDCDLGTVCAQDGSCVAPCTTDGECSAGQVCQSGLCVDGSGDTGGGTNGSTNGSTGMNNVRVMGGVGKCSGADAPDGSWLALATLAIVRSRLRRRT